MMRLVIFFAAALFTCSAAAESITAEKVIAGAEQLYRERINATRSNYELDIDPVFLERVQRTAAGLIRQAKKDHPVAASYLWEIHISDAPDESASCMAGGKLLVGRRYVQALQLSDAELAMLLSHEIQHAVLEHNLKEFQEALRLEPQRQSESFLELENAIDHDTQLMEKLSDLDKAQESEADLEGLRMAVRAGWPPLALAGYFKKLAHADALANVEHDDHPSSALRWRAAHELAESLLDSASQSTIRANPSHP